MGEAEGCKQALKSFHSSRFCKAHCKVEELRRKLAAVETLPDLVYNISMQEEEKELSDQSRKWSKIDESILKQKN